MSSSVLVIEDNADSLEALTILLSQEFSCKGVRSRDEALSLLNSGYAPACIVSDYSMPGMSMDDFLKQLEPRKIKVILLSAHADVVDAANRFKIKRALSKPTEPDRIIQAIRESIGSGEHSAV